MSNFKLLPARERIAQPWKNGGGVMWDIAIFPEDATTETFAWRLSIAEISASRPFSLFQGVKRHFALLEGDGVTLSIAGQAPLELTPNDPAIEFSGDVETVAVLHHGPVLALNLMTRDGFVGALHHVSFGFEPPNRTDHSGAAIFIATSEELCVELPGNTHKLERFDALQFASEPSVFQVRKGDTHWRAMVTPETVSQTSAQTEQSMFGAVRDTKSVPR